MARLLRWIAEHRYQLGLVLCGLVGLALRLHGLGSRYFWYDEALILDMDWVFRPAFKYAGHVWRTTTYNPGWPLAVWVWVQALGDSLVVARMPSCLAGTLAILAVYWATGAFELDRPTALLAALLTALSWPLIDNARQIMPYAALPLLSALCVGVIGRIHHERDSTDSTRLFKLHGCLVVCCALFVFVHNSFLIMIPILGLFLIASVFVGSSSRADRERAQARDLALRLRFALVSGFLIVVPSILFYLPKRRAGFRAYLGSYYLATFRDTPLALGNLLNQLDLHYRSRVVAPHPWHDTVYFIVSRTLDLLCYHLNPVYTLPADRWRLAAFLPVSALFIAGLAILARGRAGRTAACLAWSSAVGWLVILLLSLLRLYPYGGVRQLLPLAPIMTIVTAAGARRCLARRPRLATLAIGLFTLLALGSAPGYYDYTCSTFDRADFRELIRRTGTRFIVSGDGDFTALPLRYAGKAVPRVRIMPTYFPEFDRLIERREPFLVMTLATPALMSTPDGWRVNPDCLSLNPARLKLEQFTVEPLRHGGDASLTNPYPTFLLQPRLELARSRK